MSHCESKSLTKETQYLGVAGERRRIDHIAPSSTLRENMQAKTSTTDQKTATARELG